MVNYNDGNIHGWNGGDCPVHPYSNVRVWLREGVVNEGIAKRLIWCHKNAYYYDIVAFQVLNQYVEPKTIWANEYKHDIFVYTSKEEAESGAGVNAIRKAVKYVEVQE